MPRDHYVMDPNLRDYFLSLSAPVQNALIDSRLEISTLGELQMWAEHYKKDHPDR